MKHSEIVKKVVQFKHDLVKYYHVESFRLLQNEDDKLTLAVSFDAEADNVILTKKELEMWLSNMFKVKTDVLNEKLIKEYVSKHPSNSLVLN